MKIVTNQGSDWDPSKAHAIASTTLQQNPDLCGVVGFWDVMDLGAAAAIKESGKPIALVTSGGGEQMACDNVAKALAYGRIAAGTTGQAQTFAGTTLDGVTLTRWLAERPRT